MKKNRIIALIIALTLCLGMLTACSQPANEEQPASSEAADTTLADPQEPVETVTGISDETLVIATEGEPNSLCPQYSGGNVNARVDVQLYDTLVYWNDAEKKSEPAVATEWEWIDEYHLSIKLRDDVYFSNGDQLTAKDVAFTFTIGQDFALSTYYAKLDPENFEIIDDQNIILAFTAPVPHFMEIVGSTHYALLSEKAYQDAGEDLSVLALEPVTSGKYVLEEWKQGESITLTRNEDHWDQENLPYYKTLTFNIITDAASRVIALQSGQVQLAFNVSMAQAEEVDNYEGLSAQVYSQNVSKIVAYNYANEALMNPLVREAIALTVNREAMAAITTLGYADLVDTIYTPSSPVYVPVEMPETDIERAKELMAEAGYADGLTLKAMASALDPIPAEILQAQLAEIGITIEIEVNELATFLGAMFEGNFDIAVIQVDNWDYQRSLVSVDSRSGYAAAIGGSLYQGDKEQEFHDLIDAANTEMDDAARADLYAQIQEFIKDNHVAVGLYASVRCDAHSDTLSGLQYDVRGWPNLLELRPVA